MIQLFRKRGSPSLIYKTHPTVPAVVCNRRGRPVLTDTAPNSNGCLSSVPWLGWASSANFKGRESKSRVFSCTLSDTTSKAQRQFIKLRWMLFIKRREKKEWEQAQRKAEWKVEKKEAQWWDRAHGARGFWCRFWVRIRAWMMIGSWVLLTQRVELIIRPGLEPVTGKELSIQIGDWLIPW